METVGFVLLGLVAGALAATLGVGGGIVIVPALVSIFMFPQHEAQGTSLAVIVATVLIATITHARAGRVRWKLTGWAGAAGIFGAIGGARVALLLDDQILRRIFAVVVVVIAVRMGVRARSLFVASRPVDGR